MKFSHFLLLILIVLLENLHAQCTTIREIGRGSSRMKREQCQDGYGEYEGRKCCNCPPGYHVNKCSQNNGTECLSCEGESYRDHANLLDSCEPCTSCNPTANLETEEKCTVRRNTVCRCKEGYYCEEAVREECKACHSCKKCEDGFAIEKECTRTSDTVCKEVGGDAWWALIVLPIIFAILAIVYFFKKRKLFCFADKPKDNCVEDPHKDNDINERIPLKHIDLTPHLNDIVKELGPRSTLELVRGDLKDTVIQFHEVDAPYDSQERSYRTLKDWCEQQGLENAAPNLIQKLNDKGMNTTADKIKKIILTGKKK
ncbi:tumor necrosis factor receptor superfamily member 6 isoform X1 [Anguilla rostrata]|uniref:tumor necrosis factor receptor superfamily member 6 isoform X1 n=1 Tax=Anguilla rostrata TaxID=7938 RepID=UPI0030CF2988